MRVQIIVEHNYTKIKCEWKLISSYKGNSITNRSQNYGKIIYTYLYIF